MTTTKKIEEKQLLNIDIRIPKENLELKKKYDLDVKLHKEDLEKVIPFLKRSWSMQNNSMDAATNFIYKAKSFDEILNKHEVTPFKCLDYTARRYFNHVTSTAVEEMFCSYNICKKEEKYWHKTIDFYILDEPFDLKVSSFPGKFQYTREQFATERLYRNEIIKWFYRNQSKQQRFHEENRLFVVCKDKNGKVALNNNILKKELPSIKNKVEKYLEYTLNRNNEGKCAFNKVTLDNGKTVHSDIIFLEN